MAICGGRGLRYEKKSTERGLNFGFQLESLLLTERSDIYSLGVIFSTTRVWGGGVVPFFRHIRIPVNKPPGKAIGNGKEIHLGSQAKIGCGRNRVIRLAEITFLSVETDGDPFWFA